MYNLADLSTRARQVYEYIRKYQRDHGYAPSLQEIKQNTDLQSFRGITMQLEKLEMVGLIRRPKGARRAIQILERVQTENTIAVPVVGQVQAGTANFAEENREGYEDVPQSLLKGRTDAFLLKIKGTSMNLAGYFPGDFAVVVPAQVANNNDIVIARTEEGTDATIKRYKVVHGHPMLIPQSDDSQHKPFSGEGFVIQGKVIGKFNN